MWLRPIASRFRTYLSFAVVTLAAIPAQAGDCRVLIDGTGCRTRQLAIARIFEKLPGVREIEILPRIDAPAQNQRIFLIRSTGSSPTREDLIAALGRRAKHYRVLSVTPEPVPVGPSTQEEAP